jgi:hypothetical protein
MNKDFLTNINEAGNPIKYYETLIYYLNNKSLQLLTIENTNSEWKKKIETEINKLSHLPHCIILEIYDGSISVGFSGITTNKPIHFFIKGIKYTLDSCVIRDTSKQHFSACLTCDKKEMVYDGMSFHRLVPLEWKKHINSDFIWGFDGSNHSDGTPLKWNFLQGYQMLVYYRVK